MPWITWSSAWIQTSSGVKKTNSWDQLGMFVGFGYGLAMAWPYASLFALMFPCHPCLSRNSLPRRRWSTDSIQLRGQSNRSVACKRDVFESVRCSLDYFLLKKKYIYKDRNNVWGESGRIWLAPGKASDGNHQRNNRPDQPNNNEMMNLYVAVCLCILHVGHQENVYWFLLNPEAISSWMACVGIWAYATATDPSYRTLGQGTSTCCHSPS